jgi:hypothetical protein
MELAIPGIALGLMYIINGQSKTDENFVGNSDLPNVNIPNRNYPNEQQIGSRELYETSALSTVNKYDNGGGAYTDKYFNNQPSNTPAASTGQPYYSLSGNRVGQTYFEHNNMVPFFGSRISTQGDPTNTNEGILDNYAGSGSQHITKTEMTPLFAPNKNQDWTHGTPNTSDFFQSRVNPSMKYANVKPAESVSVAPGLGLGYTTDGAGGFNSGMMMRDELMPKTANDLRVANNPKASGHSLLGHEGPANSIIKSIGTSQNMGIMEKNRPDQSFELDTRSMPTSLDGNHPNTSNADIGRLFVTNGASKGEMIHSMPIDRYVNRPETTTAYAGGASSQNVSTYTTGEYMPSHNNQLGATPFGVANAQGRNIATDADYGIKSKRAYPNNRTSNNQNGRFGIVGSSLGAMIAPILDVLRPSRKENVIGTLRPYQNPGSTVPQSYVFNPADKLNTTIRETTENSKFHLNVNANQNGGAYQVSKQQAFDTNRQETGDFYYSGNSSASAGSRKTTSYESGYNQRNNDIKSSTIDGRLIKGNMSLLNGDINMRQRERDTTLKNSRSVIGSMPGQIPDAGNMGRTAGSSNKLYQNISLDRNTPDIMNALKQNPYVVDFKSAL